MTNGIEELLAAEAEAAEAAEATSDPNAPLPAHVKVTRGTARSKNLQVRFRDEEFDELADATSCARPRSSPARARPKRPP